MEEFRKKPLDERKKKSEELKKEGNAARIPVIIDKAKTSKLNSPSKIRFMIPKNFKMQYLMTIIRKDLQLQPDQGLNIIVKDSIIKLGRPRSSRRSYVRPVRKIERRRWFSLCHILRSKRLR